MAIHIVVCIKAVVAQTANRRITRTRNNSRLNPFDQCAIEAALQLKHDQPARITALSMGPPCIDVVMRETLAMGVDQAVMACDPTLADADTLATATTLAAAIGKLAPVDLVLFGTRSSDSDTGQVGPQTAVALGLPMVTGVHRFEPITDGLRVERTMDHLLEAFEVDYPAALTIRPDAVSPRDIALAGLSHAFDQDKVLRWSLTDLGLPPEQVGAKGSPTRVVSIQPTRQLRRCDMIEGDLNTMADRLIEQLVDKGLIG